MSCREIVNTLNYFRGRREQGGERQHRRGGDQDLLRGPPARGDVGRSAAPNSVKTVCVFGQSVSNSLN